MAVALWGQEKCVFKRGESEIQRVPITSYPLRLCDVGLLEWWRSNADRTYPKAESARVPGPKNGFRIGLIIPQRGKRELSRLR